MKQKFFIITICLIATLKMMAQEFTLQGRVTDDDNNPVELATVSVVSQGKVAFTSLKGEFSMHLHSADSVAVKFSMIGYKTKVRILRKPRGKQTLQVVLHTDATMLGDVNVTGEKIQSDQTQEIKIKDIKMAPSANGNGVEGIIQQQAGVSTHSELSSQYNVRGGAFDENSVYINNVEVYRPFLVRSGQQEGLSVINPYMVDKIGFSTGGYGAKYGDKMSSALDITYKTLKAKGKKPVVEGSLAASLLGTDAYIGIGTRKLSWLNSVRYKTTSYLLGSLETKGEYKPNYLDYQTYLSYQPNKQWKIDFIGYISDNHYNFEPSDRETSFGTMENVKSFRVYFDGHEKDRFLTYFGTLGITRNITVTMKEVDELVACGVDILAVQGTGALRPDGSTSAQFIRAIKAKYPDQLLMADCDNFENAMLCAEAGADFVGTTMRGYTPETQGINDIDFEFVHKLAAECPAKIIAEGHIHYPEQAVKALEAGAFALVVGGAITRPAEITARFTGAINAMHK